MDILKRKRLEAFQVGMLVSQSKDYVPVEIDFENKKIAAEVRLKGDWLDHLKGSKWSYRVKLEDDFSVLGMQRFSLHHPRTRSYLDEWVFHQMLEHEDILTPAYTFVQVWWNEEYKGVYALEEHFSPTLLARQHRKDAPILKFSEDGFWQLQAHHQRYGKNLTPYMPDFEAAEIQPFQKKRILKDSILSFLFMAGREKLEDLRETKQPASKLLDMERWAKFYALTDLFTAYHSLRWHNQRFYYDGAKGQIEPVVFDAYGQKGSYRWFSKSFLGFHNERYSKVYFVEEYMIFYLFNEPSFRKQYIYFLEKYSHPDFLNIFKTKIKPQLDTLEKVLQTEEPTYEYNFDKVFESAKNIRQFIADYSFSHPPFEYTIYAPLYEECLMRMPAKDIGLTAAPSADGQQIFVKNYFCLPVQIHATGPKRSKPIHELDRPITLPVFDIFQQPPQEEIIPFFKGDRYVFYSVPDINYWFKKKITTLPHAKNINFQLKDSLQIDSSIFQIDGKNLNISSGNFKIENTIVIPSDFTLTIDAGAQIDLVNGAAFFIYGQVLMKGTKSRSIHITSSDKTGRGWHFINNKEMILVEHVNFNHLAEWKGNGLLLSGGVNVIESKAVFSNCKFSNSYSEDALNVVRSDSIVLRNTTFKNCKSDALDIDFSKILVSDCDFFQIKGDAVDLSGSSGEINNLKINDVIDKGLSIGEKSSVLVSNIDCEYANIGLAVKDGSNLSGGNYTFPTVIMALRFSLKKHFMKVQHSKRNK